MPSASSARRASGSRYTARDISVLKGLEPVRRRPAMYIGGVDARGLHHLIWEILDNAVDEVINGHASRIEVILATGIPEPMCRQLNLGYMDPVSVRIEEYQNREDQGVLFVDHAGEMLHRVKGEE